MKSTLIIKNNSVFRYILKKGNMLKEKILLFTFVVRKRKETTIILLIILVYVFLKRMEIV